MGSKDDNSFDDAAERMRQDMERFEGVSLGKGRKRVSFKPEDAEAPKTSPLGGEEPGGEQLLTASGKLLTDALPTPQEVAKVVSEPEERIDVEQFLHELREETEAEATRGFEEPVEPRVTTGAGFEEITEEATEAEEAPRGEAAAPTAQAEKRQQLLGVVHDEELGAFKPEEVGERQVDLKTVDVFKDHSAAAVKVINALFASDNCSEIHGNAPDKLFARYKGQRVGVRAEFSSEKEYNGYLKSLVDRGETMQSWEELVEIGRGVIRLADGSSLTLTFPPLTKYTSFSVRKHTAQHWGFDQLVKNGTMNKPMGEFLKLCAASRINILIVGELGSGKTTLLSLLTQFFPDGERIALIQEVPEIFMYKPDVVPFTYSPMAFENKATLDKIIDTALYMRFDRIIVGEVHDKGIFYLLKGMHLGSDGSMSTFHAGSGRDALDMLKNHMIMENSNFSAASAAEYIRGAINLIVVLEHQGDQHRIIEISEVDWRSSSSQNPEQIALIGLWEFDRSDGIKGKFINKGRPDDQGPLRKRVLRAGAEINPEWFAAVETNIAHEARKKTRR